MSQNKSRILRRSSVGTVELKGKCIICQISGRDWGHAGLFFKGRKALPHFIERRISLKIHLRTAPEEISSINGHLSRLCCGSILESRGRWAYGVRIYVAAFKKETRMSPQEMRLYLDFLRCYVNASKN